VSLANHEALFSAGRFRAVELNDGDIPALQTFFERNPEYYHLVSGQPPRPDEAYQEMHEPLPHGWPYTRRWILGLIDDASAIAGVTNVVADLLAPRVWHIGFYLIATKLHGGGIAVPLYDALETWMRDQGAVWLRLGVVDGNVRAERFWERRGYVEVRKRSDIPMGARVNTISVRVKPLTGSPISDYLALVERDRP